MRLRLGILAGLLFAFCCGAAFAQGSVAGDVVNGGTKPAIGMTVRLNNSLDPKRNQTTVTDTTGHYEFDNVPEGKGYTVVIFDVTGRRVGVDTDPHSQEFAMPSDPAYQRLAIPQIDIAYGLTAERESVAGGIQNDLGVSPGTNISNQQVRLLPLYNRNFLNLGLIQPEVHDVEQGSPLQGAAFSIAGSRSTSTNFLLDGVDNVASSTNQAIPFQVNEAVREFRVTYSNPDLRYGQGSGGIVEVRTSSGKTGSGGHDIHGSAFGFFNNDSLNGNTPLSVYSNSGFFKAAAYAGGTGDASQLIYVNNPQPPPSGVPADCSTSGNIFCGYSPQTYNALFNLFKNHTATAPPVSKGAPIPTIDPGCATAICNAGAFNPAAVLSSQDSRTQPVTSKQFGFSLGGKVNDHLYLFGSYEGTLIDNPTPIFERVPTFLDRNTSGILSLNANDSKIAQSLLGLFPGPNVGQAGSALSTGTNTGIFGFYRGTAPNYTHVHNVQVRPDIQLGKIGSVTLRYTGQLLDQLHDDTLPAGGAYPGNGADRRAQNQNAALSYSFPFGSSTNVLNIAFTQYRVDEVAQDRGFNVSSLGLPAGPMPTVVISGIDPQTSAPQGAGAFHTTGYIGGWYDSFWQTNCDQSGPGSGLSACNASAAGARSPSPITPSLDGDFPLARLGAPLTAPAKRRDTEAFLSDVLDLHLSGRNLLSLGGDYRYQQNYSFDGGMFRGLIVSNNIGEMTRDSETCTSCNAFTTGFVHPSFDYELRQPLGYTGDLRSSTFGIFAEHKFQPTTRSTLLAGVRYEYFGQPLDTQNRLWNYNLINAGLNRQGGGNVTYDAFDYQCKSGGTTFFDAVYGTLRASTPANGTICNPGTFQLPQIKNDVTGMFGFSYAVDDRAHTVIRAAIGAYFDHEPASRNEKLLLNRPSPYNVGNPSAIYGQNFASTYSTSSCQIGTQCALGWSTLNFAGSSFTPQQTATFQNYQAASGAEVLYSRDPNALKTPYSLQISTGVQRQLGGSWTGELAYVGSLGYQLPLVYDGNFSTEFYCQSINSVCANDTYFPVFTQSNIGASNYHSVLARVEARLWHGLSMHASYTYAKSLDNIAGSDFPNATDSLFTQLYGRQLYGLGNPAVFALQNSTAGYGSNGGVRGQQLADPNVRTAVLQSANIPSFDAVQSALTTTGSRTINVSRYNLPQNPLAFSSSGAAVGEDYGPSDFDVRHRGVADFVYRLPFRGRWAGGFVVSGITTVQSGQPFTIFSGPAYGQITQRAYLASNTSARLTGNPNRYITGLDSTNLPAKSPLYAPTNTCPSIYAQPSLYRASSRQAACVGNSGRNAFTGPAYFSQDVAVQKGISFIEGQSLVLRAEFFNLFNRANYYNPISEISTDGVHLNPEFGLVRSAHDPRQIQFAVRYDF